MALSNWDTLAYGPDGTPSNGILEGFHGQSVEIYKNWAYVQDPKSWHNDLGYAKPTIAEVQSGKCNISRFDITARRGPQEAIFLYAECYNYEEDDLKNRLTKRMAGIGCYGYDDPAPKLAAKAGINLDDYDDHLHSYSFSGGESTVNLLLFKDGEMTKEISFPLTDELDSKWVGVTTETFAEFMRWLRKDIIDSGDKEFFEWLEKCKASDSLRFNQGDNYFADQVGAPLEGTAPGEQSEPILTQMLKNMPKADD